MTGFSKEYEDLADTVAGLVEDAGEERAGHRFVEMTDMAFKSISDAESELEKARSDAADGFIEAREEIADAWLALVRARQNLLSERSGLFAGMAEAEEAHAGIIAGLTALDGAASESARAARELAHTCANVLNALAELELGGMGFAETESALRVMYADNPAGLAEGLSGLSGARARLGAARAELLANYDAALVGESAARASLNQINAERGALLAELDGLNGDSRRLDAGLVEINIGLANVSRRLNELDRQAAALEEQDAEQSRAFASSAEAIAASRKALEDIALPEWYVSDRGANAGHSGFVGDADKIEAIGRVFPVIFYVVAALVSLTTMTRLVEERRVEIGTLKALGYGNLKIMSKYIVYAAVPTLLGGVVGDLFGMSFFPSIIITLYSSLYAVPEPVTIINAAYWGLGVGIAAASTLAATVSACLGELRAQPATLLRPKPPKLGARIFLEYVPFLWKSLSFIRKVTLRNIVRYKKRFFMTVTGIAGCTALLMTGFGLRDSISTMITLQYGEINKYDITIAFTDTAKQSDVDSVGEYLLDNESVRGTLKFRQKKYDVGAAETDAGAGAVKRNMSAAVVSASLVVPEDTEAFVDFTLLRDRRTHEKVPFREDGVVLSEKMTALLDVGVGDAIYIDDDGERVMTQITGICENYAEHYIFMSPGLHTRLFGEEPDYNTIYVTKNNNISNDAIQRLANITREKKALPPSFSRTRYLEHSTGL
jgi:putative ABC transport system permease protein